MNNYRNFIIIALPGFLTDPQCTCLGWSELIEKLSLRRTVVHSVTTSGCCRHLENLNVIDWTSLRLSESNQETRQTHGEPRTKTNSSLLPPWMIVSGIDYSSLTQFEYVHEHVKGSL